MSYIFKRINCFVLSSTSLCIVVEKYNQTTNTITDLWHLTSEGFQGAAKNLGNVIRVSSVWKYSYRKVKMLVHIFTTR